MRAYELMYIIRPALEEEATQAIVDRFENLVKELGGQVDNINQRGKKRLSYEIDDLKEGYYVIMNFKAETEVISELERQIGLTENIMRHIVIREDE